MFTLNNQKLLSLIRYTPVVVVCLFISITYIILIQDNQDKAAFNIKTLKQSLLTQQRDVIREQVYQVSKQLRITKSRTDNQIKKDIKQQVNNVYNLVQHIFLDSKNLPDPEVKALVFSALKTLFLFHSQEQLFILDHQGKNLMKQILPSPDKYPAPDLLYQHIQVNYADHTEGFYDAFSLPNQPAEIIYLKQFVPFQWTIGIRQYKKEPINQMKSKTLEWFSNYEYGEGGYFFVLNKSGKLLAHHYNDFFGPNLTPGNNISQALFSDILEQTDHGGGYVRYQKPLTISGQTSLKQIIYVKEVKGWDWIIGTGFYSERFENYLTEKAAQLNRYNHIGMLKLSIIAIISTILLILVSLYFSQLIAKRFDQFQQRIIKDVNNLEKTKDQMEYMAHHDALTGLPNRILMLRKINENLKLASKNHTYVAVMFVDLDNFKNINDLYGHAVGDQSLKMISRKFESVLSTQDIVSRFGGDEFIFCFTGLHHITEAREKVELIHKALKKPLILDGKILPVGCSIGITMYPSDSADAETLISKADAVLYMSKSHKKGEALFYDQTISQQIQFDLTVENELHQALSQCQIYVLYQPQVNIQTGKTIGVEALARWDHDTLGPIPTAKFIETAEKTGLIHQLGLFVFRQACDDICHLSVDGELIRLSVNISPKQLIDPDLPQHLNKICKETHMDPRRITLEITENVLIDRLEEITPRLDLLKESGFGISLDDFGTGYSSLNYLHHLPLTEIKIDRSFTKKLPDSPQSEMLVKMIISIGRFCDLTVVAEGLETEAQLNKLKACHCDLAQGYYFDHPVPVKQLSAIVKKFRNVPVAKL